MRCMLSLLNTATFSSLCQPYPVDRIQEATSTEVISILSDKTSVDELFEGGIAVRNHEPYTVSEANFRFLIQPCGAICLTKRGDRCESPFVWNNR